MVRLIESANIEGALKERIDRILSVERETLKKQGYNGPSRLAVVAKLLELGINTWEHERTPTQTGERT